MIFVNDIISDGKLCIIGDLLPGKRRFPALFLLLPTEQIALGDHAELDLRILKALMNAAGDHQNLPRKDFLRLPSGVSRRFLGCPPRRNGRQIIVPQILRQTLRPGAGARQQHHAVFVPLPALQILQQTVKIAGVADHGLAHHLKTLFGADHLLPPAKSR